MTTISKEDIDSAFESINRQFNGDFWADLNPEGLANEFAYEGFDPRRIAMMVLKMPVALNSKAADIGSMIALAVERGNRIDKMVNKMSEEGVAKVNALKRVYKISEKASRKDTITLSRVALSFPHFTCQYVQSHAINLTVDPEICKAYYKTNYALPRCMMNPAFGNLIPESGYDELFNAYVKAQVVFSVIIDKKKDIRAKESEAHSYATIARRNKLIPNGTRIEILKQLGALSPNGKISQAIINFEASAAPLS
uniref:Nucleoprotein n=1 Tax=Hymenopteran phenui-related virus OKIAV306 TaxID=2746256 RepID=A0A7D7JIG7_9VIRU|nr:nucleocapsid protein [Hymenopteran phenui-related virus OKIAV306]